MSDPTRRGRHPSDVQCAWVLFLTLLFTYAYFQPDPGANGYTRVSLVRALVEDHTTQIDRFQADTTDIAWFNGHYYTDKPPGASFLALPMYAGYFAWLRGVYGENAARQQTLRQREIGLYLSTLAAIRLPSALAVTFFFVVTNSLCQSRTKALFAAAALGLGSLAFPFSVVFFSHQLTGALLFIAFGVLVLERRRPQNQQWRMRSILLAGFAAGYAVITDLTATLGALVLAAYLLWVTREGRRLLPLILGGMLPVALLAAYGWASFGNPLDLGYRHITNQDYASGMRLGFMGITYPKVSTLVQIVGGTYRGFLPLSPVLVLSGIGVYQMWRRRPLRPELAASAAIVVLYLLLNASYVFWDGGYSLGPRHVIPMLAFLCVPIPFGLGKNLWVATVLLVVSVIHMLAGATFGPVVPQTYANPLVDYLYAQLASRGAWAKILPPAARLLHLDGPVSLAPLLVVWLTAGAFLFWPRRHGLASRRQAR